MFKPALKLSDVFDFEFYRAQVKGRPPASFDAAAAHYTSKGWRAGLSPSPFFDTRFYRANNPDIGDVSPLAHYLVYGQFEGRRPSEGFDPSARLTETGRLLRSRCIGAVDRSAYLSQQEASLQSDIDPVMHYFAFGHAADFGLTDKFDAEHYLTTNEDVREAGIVPLLHYLEFGFMEGRSPHPSQTWLLPPWELLVRAHLVRAHVVPKVYNAQFPTASVTTIDICLHYLLYGERAGIRPNAWFDLARAERESPSQSDTLTHLERHLIATGAIKELPIHRPDDLDPTSGSFANIPLSALLPVDDWGAVKARNGFDVDKTYSYRGQNDLTPFDIPDTTETFGTPEIDDAFVRHVAQQAKGGTLSCDIWDTVLRRDCYPDETKLRAARALWLTQRHAYPHLSALHPIDVLQMRRVAEAKASDAVFEFQFEEMSALWLSYLRITDPDALRSVAQAELTIETRTTSPDPTVTALLSGFEGRKIAISDFYLGADALRTLLDSNGVSPFDAFYVSCDHMETKRQGGLYDVAASREPDEPRDILHIGDRFGTDVENAQRHGFSAELYASPFEERRNTASGKAYHRHLNGDFTEHAANLSKITGFDPNGATCPAQALTILFVGFALQIIEEAYRTGQDTVYFFSREGAFFKTLFEEAVSQDVYDTGAYPKADMLYTSRRASFAASLADLSPEHLMRLWSQYSTQSLAALAVTLNIPVESWKAAALRHDLDLETPIEFPWKDPRVLSFLADPEVRDAGRECLWAQRDALLQYLTEIGFAPKENLSRMIVDIGWRGTIQDNLARVTNGTLHGCYLGLEEFLNPQATRTTKCGYLFDENRGDQRPISEFAALEFISNALGGSVIGYHDGEPLREVIEGEERCITEQVLPLQREILATAKDVLAYVGRHGLVSEDLRHLANMIARAYMKAPDQRVADAFVTLEHNETFGTGSADHMGEETALSFASDSPDYAIHAASAEHFAKRRWVNASLASKEFETAFEELPPAQRLSLARPDRAPAIPSHLRSTAAEIAIYAPHPIWGSGGHRTIYNLAKALTHAGHNVHVLSEGRGEQYGYLEQELAGTGITTHDTWQTPISPDVAIATIMHSASTVAALYGDDVQKFYLVQDNEAEFNMLSDGFVRGENSFAQGLQHLCVGHWLPHLIQTRFGSPAIGAGLGVDTTIYRPFDDIEKRKRIAVLYQPDKPRRMPELALEALRRVKLIHPDLEIVTYGSAPRPDLPFEFEHLGLVDDLAHLNGLYNSSPIGLCISLTNPSRIPFEMMAAGCIPVDVYRYNNLFDYSDGSALLAYQSPASLAAAFDHLLRNPDECAARREKSIEIAKMRTLRWETDIHVNAIEAVLRGEDLSQIPATGPSYNSPAFLAQRTTRPPCAASFTGSRRWGNPKRATNETCYHRRDCSGH
ncbi:rhamnosyltransferase WsaF family glycosyltransferase [Celeribacter litoreus]|uniref:rhamnosyltransferase WsaF family glycosyltransferase n=1 Tax=Celeribacter litoreus TaxID=2876714 RepID=UPI001CCC8E0F|nr:hypothetical protein [Celeribacter litoreus]MCA0045096.1 hypothetical protein [Celeribacter litoreus]